MGYTTEFSGAFRVTPPLRPAHVRFLQRFNETRRMRRSVEELEQVADPIREAAGLPIGDDGALFVGSEDPFGQDWDHPSVTDPNRPPRGQPSLWCNWRPSDDGATIEWDGVEKFSHYVEWLEYLIATFLEPWGHTLSGEVTWEGEVSLDRGSLRVQDNVVELVGEGADEPASDEEIEELMRELGLDGDE